MRDFQKVRSEAFSLLERGAEPRYGEEAAFGSHSSANQERRSLYLRVRWWIRDLALSKLLLPPGGYLSFSLSPGEKEAAAGAEAPCVPPALGTPATPLRCDGTGAQSCLGALERLLWGSVPPSPNLPSSDALFPDHPKGLGGMRQSRVPRALISGARRCCSNSSKGEGDQFPVWVLILAVKGPFQRRLNVGIPPFLRGCWGSGSRTRAQPPSCDLDVLQCQPWRRKAELSRIWFISPAHPRTPVHGRAKGFFPACITPAFGILPFGCLGAPPNQQGSG